MREQHEMTDSIEQIVNRHIARLMTNLEAANCPEVYKQAAKAELTWLRSDLKELTAN
jgi:hypothetical protein